MYFADPHVPWQKGGIENTNSLIRQYIPNGTDLKNISLQRIKMIQRKINARPREKLNFLTPDEVVYKKDFVNLHLIIDSAQELNARRMQNIVKLGCGCLLFENYS